MPEYEIIDNRERKYIVVDNGDSSAEIYLNDQPVRVLLMRINSYKKIFVGIDSVEQMHGNSILFELDDQSYIFVGMYIYLFHTTEPILQYFSPMGNNMVPYPYAITSKHTYIMLGQQVINNIDRNDKDPHTQFYDDSRNFKNFSVTILISR